jgi:hypothetical protein
MISPLVTVLIDWVDEVVVSGAREAVTTTVWRLSWAQDGCPVNKESTVKREAWEVIAFMESRNGEDMATHEVGLSKMSNL